MPLRRIREIGGAMSLQVKGSRRDLALKCNGARLQIDHTEEVDAKVAKMKGTLPMVSGVP